MQTYENFWTVSIFRGIFAVLIGSALLVVPDMARTLLFLPFVVAFAIVSLAAYGVVDSVLIFVTSFFTSLRPARAALRLQSVLGIVIGALFCSILFDRIHIEWFLYLIALQAFSMACNEFVIARHTSRKHGSRWSYFAAMIAFTCCVAYGVAAIFAPSDLSPRQIVTLAYAYLAAFGIAEVLMATRMLYIERNVGYMAHGK